MPISRLSSDIYNAAVSLRVYSTNNIRTARTGINHGGLQLMASRDNNGDEMSLRPEHFQPV